MNAVVEEKAKELLKLDIGCGPNPRAGFIGVDAIKFPNVNVVLNVGKEKWPWDDGSVGEFVSSHFLEHLTGLERVHFYNELNRVLAVGAKGLIICPHWASNRAYGDPTHQWPPVSEMSFYYLDREWRKANAPHTDKEHWAQGYDCDLKAEWGYGMHQALTVRGADYQQYAMAWYKEACQDTHVTITKK